MGMNNETSWLPAKARPQRVVVGVQQQGPGVPLLDHGGGFDQAPKENGDEPGAVAGAAHAGGDLTYRAGDLFLHSGSVQPQ